ncbi:hypothetical protein NGRA_1671 [Nosema granulosis]|uniref:Uncharacterized protein n=1 Tax=Nosema granulosis TaxID=83296 RepID=A0A9P6GYK0_9MICR|nr:hypothetical protein NGRA_1671 [Nosema granulosis]
MALENQREEIEEIISMQESTLEEELKKVKDEGEMIDFMDIVDKACIVQNEETSSGQNEDTSSGQNEETSGLVEDSIGTEASFSPQQNETKYSQKEGSEKNKQASLEELNWKIQRDGEGNHLIKKKAEVNISQLKPFKKEAEIRKVIRLESDLLGAKGLPTLFVDNLRIKKYPGFLYVNIASIERYMSTDKNVKSVNIRLESDDMVYETPQYTESPSVEMNIMVYFSVRNMESPIKIRFILQKHFRDSERVEKACETDLVIDKDTIEQIHNNITEFENVWTPYTSNNFIKNFFSFFTDNVADAWCLKTHLAYISEEELQVVGGPTPKDLYELSRWIKIKKYSYTSWFAGFVNIRGNLQDVCTFLWKRRYVQWCGYVISVYNDQSRTLVGTINLIDIIIKGNENITSLDDENKIRIIFEKSLIEFHFDSIDKFNTFKQVIDAIL